MKIIFLKRNFSDTSEEWYQNTEIALKKLFSEQICFRYEGNGHIANLSLKYNSLHIGSSNTFSKGVNRKVILDKKMTLSGEYYGIQVTEIFFLNPTTLFISGELTNQDGYIIENRRMELKRFVRTYEGKIIIRDDSRIVWDKIPQTPLKSKGHESQKITPENSSPEEYAKYLKFLAKCERQEKIDMTSYISTGYTQVLLRGDIQKEFEPSILPDTRFNPDEKVRINVRYSAKGYHFFQGTLTVGYQTYENKTEFLDVLSYEILKDETSTEVFSGTTKVTSHAYDYHWGPSSFTRTENYAYRYRTQVVSVETSVGTFIVHYRFKETVE